MENEIERRQFLSLNFAIAPIERSDSDRRGSLWSPAPPSMAPRPELGKHEALCEA